MFKSVGNIIVYKHLYFKIENIYYITSIAVCVIIISQLNTIY